MKDKLRKVVGWLYGEDSDTVLMRVLLGLLALIACAIVGALLCGFVALVVSDPLAALWVVVGLVGIGLLLPFLGRAAEWFIDKYF